jgi:hypothetical protein
MSTDDAARIFGDRYVLGERLTAGDTREVWRAHDDVVRRQVALKIFFGTAAADPSWQDRFRRRASQLTALSHPGIAKVYDHGESATEAWLAMAFIDGAPLSERLTSGQPLPAAVGLDLVGQAAMALAAAHAAGITHGALSPASLIIRDGAIVFLIGFGFGAEATAADDLAALGDVATACLGPAVATPGQSAEVSEFLAWLTDPSHAKPPQDAAAIGRTALALAASLTSTGPDADSAAASPALPSGEADEDKPAKAWRHDETPEEAAKRKEVRNRLLVLGTIVVVGGAALLRFVGEGGGQVTVPSVVNLQIDQAKLKLTSAGLRPTEACVVGVDSGNTVSAQTPPAGREVKAGSNVVLTVTAETCP